MYFPEEPEPVPTQCPGCKGWYVVPRGPRLMCGVMHAPGTCCHYGEVKAEAPKESEEQHD